MRVWVTRTNRWHTCESNMLTCGEPNLPALIWDELFSEILRLRTEVGKRTLGRSKWTPLLNRWFKNTSMYTQHNTNYHLLRASIQQTLCSCVNFLCWINTFLSVLKPLVILGGVLPQIISGQKTKNCPGGCFLCQRPRSVSGWKVPCDHSLFPVRDFYLLLFTMSQSHQIWFHDAYAIN